MTIAANADFVIDQGADFFAELYWTDYNGVPISLVSPIRMEIRSQTGQMVAELMYIDEESEAGEQSPILFNTDSGLIQIQLPYAKTDAIPPGMYVYDLFVTYQDNLTINLRRYRLLYGNVEVRGKVTRSV